MLQCSWVFPFGPMLGLFLLPHLSHSSCLSFSVDIQWLLAIRGLSTVPHTHLVFSQCLDLFIKLTLTMKNHENNLFKLILTESRQLLVSLVTSRKTVGYGRGNASEVQWVLNWWKAKKVLFKHFPERKERKERLWPLLHLQEALHFSGLEGGADQCFTYRRFPPFLSGACTHPPLRTALLATMHDLVPQCLLAPDATDGKYYYWHTYSQKREKSTHISPSTPGLWSSCELEASVLYTCITCPVIIPAYALTVS